MSADKRPAGTHGGHWAEGTHANPGRGAPGTQTGTRITAEISINSQRLVSLPDELVNVRAVAESLRAAERARAEQVPHHLERVPAKAIAAKEHSTSQSETGSVARAPGPPRRPSPLLASRDVSEASEFAVARARVPFKDPIDAFTSRVARNGTVQRRLIKEALARHAAVDAAALGAASAATGHGSMTAYGVLADVSVADVERIAVSLRAFLELGAGARRELVGRMFEIRDDAEANAERIAKRHGASLAERICIRPLRDPEQGQGRVRNDLTKKLIVLALAGRPLDDKASQQGLLDPAAAWSPVTWGEIAAGLRSVFS